MDTHTHTHTHTSNRKSAPPPAPPTTAVQDVTDHPGDCHADVGHSVGVHCKELWKTLISEQLPTDALGQQKLLTQINEPAATNKRESQLYN